MIQSCTFIFLSCCSQLRSELLMRIQKEAKPVLRQVEKLRERFSQRYLRHTRALQDKRLRDKNLAVRNGKESQALTRSAEDKAVSQLHRDIKAWNSEVVERIELGKAVFLGSSSTNNNNGSNNNSTASATDHLRSPLKESKTPSRATSVAVESFDKLIVSDKLKQYLASPSQQRGGGTDGVHAATAAAMDTSQSRITTISNEDALHMLVDYFNSGGKSGEK